MYTSTYVYTYAYACVGEDMDIDTDIDVLRGSRFLGFSAARVGGQAGCLSAVASNSVPRQGWSTQKGLLSETRMLDTNKAQGGRAQLQNFRPQLWVNCRARQQLGDRKVGLGFFQSADGLLCLCFVHDKHNQGFEFGRAASVDHACGPIYKARGVDTVTIAEARPRKIHDRGIVLLVQGQVCRELVARLKASMHQE